MTRVSPLMLIASLVSACAVSGVRESALPAESNAVQTALPCAAPPCQAPEHLVRDLTVPWRARVYAIGPCPLPNPSAVSSAPEAPAGLNLSDTAIRNP